MHHQCIRSTWGIYRQDNPPTFNIFAFVWSRYAAMTIFICLTFKPKKRRQTRFCGRAFPDPLVDFQGIPTVVLTR